MRSWILYSAVFALLTGLCCNSPFSATVEVQYPAVLREQPGPASRELLSLAPGTPLAETGRVSSFVTPFELDSQLFIAPWIEVRTRNGETGWLLAGQALPVDQAPTDWFLRLEMLCFWGPALTQRRDAWLERQNEVRDDDAFAAGYREAVALRDTLMLHLARRAEPNEADFDIDYSWVGEALPGFVYQRVAGNTQPHAFADYRVWMHHALATNGEHDDTFIRVCLQAFPADSIESFFPAWTIQTGDNTGSSQLGLGRHLHVLRAVDAALTAGDLFAPELNALKNRVLADILDQDNTYWQPADKILAELTAIESADLRCLDERDRLALDARRKMFEAVEENGIRVNLRAGEQ